LLAMRVETDIHNGPPVSLAITFYHYPASSTSPKVPRISSTHYVTRIGVAQRWTHGTADDGFSEVAIDYIL
jgi:hypothetical protein